MDGGVDAGVDKTVSFGFDKISKDKTGAISDKNNANNKALAVNKVVTDKAGAAERVFMHDKASHTMPVTSRVTKTQVSNHK